MEAENHDLLSRVLHLPENQRAELAARLIESLDGPGDQGVEAAWSAEIKRRLDELEAGSVNPLSWEKARRRIFGSINDR